jgi:hypothetical protein
LKEKQGRLLDRYLQGNLPQASDVVKSSQMEAEAERLAQMRTTLHQKIQADGKRAVTDDLISGDAKDRNAGERKLFLSVQTSWQSKNLRQ